MSGLPKLRRVFRRECLQWTLALAAAWLMGRPAEAQTLEELGERLERILYGDQVPPGLVLEHRKMRGLEQCAVCGKSVNMGSFLLRLEGGEAALSCPYLGAHALREHG